MSLGGCATRACPSSTQTCSRARRGAGQPGPRRRASRVSAGGADAGRELDRARLGEIVFRDEQARRDLEAIIHPDRAPAHRRVLRATCPPDDAVCRRRHSAALRNGGARAASTPSIVVGLRARDADRAHHGARRSSRDAAERRIAAQLPIGEKCRARITSFAPTDARGHGRQVTELLSRFARGRTRFARGLAARRVRLTLGSDRRSVPHVRTSRALGPTAG